MLKGSPTKRAPDVWESARFTSIFLASGFFLLPNIVHARPHAGNANRWAIAAPIQIYKLFREKIVIIAEWI